MWGERTQSVVGLEDVEAGRTALRFRERGSWGKNAWGSPRSLSSVLRGGLKLRAVQGESDVTTSTRRVQEPSTENPHVLKPPSPCPISSHLADPRRPGTRLELGWVRSELDVRERAVTVPRFAIQLVRRLVALGPGLAAVSPITTVLALTCAHCSLRSQARRSRDLAETDLDLIVR